MNSIHISRERLEEAMGFRPRTIESFPVARRPYVLWLVRVGAVALLVVFWGWQVADLLDGGPYFGALQGSVGVLISGSLVGQALAFGAFGRSEKVRAAGRCILLSVTIVVFATLLFILALLGAQLSGNVAGWGTRAFYAGRWSGRNGDLGCVHALYRATLSSQDGVNG